MNSLVVAVLIAVFGLWCLALGYLLKRNVDEYWIGGDAGE